MVQKRVKIGKEFEEKYNNGDWVILNKKPRVKWCGDGKTIFEKIKNINYDHLKLYTLPETNWKKSDILNIVDGRERELKKYKKQSIKSWKLYSEPFFKVARRNQLNKIDKELYNTFLINFYNHNLENGFFDEVIKKMILDCEGIQIIDEFIKMENIEFRTILSENEWKGYHRIKIEFKLKNSFD